MVLWIRGFANVTMRLQSAIFSGEPLHPMPRLLESRA